MSPSAPHDLVSFLVTCALIEITPGPNMAYLAVLSATEGRRAGLAATLGIALGLFIVGIASALGVAALIAASDTLYQALRWLGVAYLVWLAWDGWTSAEETSPASAGAADAADDRRYFQRGLITNLLNPKAGMFFVAILPGFVAPEGAVLTQTLLLSVLYVAIATAVHASLVLLAGAARPLLLNPERSRMARRVLSLALFAIAIWFAIKTGR